MTRGTVQTILIGALVAIFTIIFVVAFFASDKVGLALGISFGLTIGIAIVYLAACFETVSAEEAAIKLILEKPDDKEVYSKGWLLLLKPFEKLYKFPKEQQRLEFPSEKQSPFKVITGKKRVDRQTYSEADIEVKLVIYFSWPFENIKNLIKAYVNGPDPYDMAAVAEFFEDFVLGVTRRTMGNLSWIECRRGRVDGLDEKDPCSSINKCISKSLVGMGPFEKVGITNERKIRVGITKIILPASLDEAITKPQIAQYEAQQIKTLAEAERVRLKLKGEGDAAGRDAIFKAISEQGNVGLIYETLLTLREMAQGTSNTILYGLPPFVADVLKDKTGFEPTPEQTGKVVKYFTDLLGKYQRGEKLTAEEQGAVEEFTKAFMKGKKSTK